MSTSIAFHLRAADRRWDYRCTRDGQVLAAGVSDTVNHAVVQLIEALRSSEAAESEDSDALMCDETEPLAC